MIITCSRSHLEELCVRRGYSFFRASGCVVSSAGDILAVDMDHVDYPAERVGMYEPSVRASILGDGGTD